MYGPFKMRPPLQKMASCVIKRTMVGGDQHIAYILATHAPARYRERQKALAYAEANEPTDAHTSAGLIDSVMSLRITASQQHINLVHAPCCVWVKYIGLVSFDVFACLRPVSKASLQGQSARPVSNSDAD